MGWAGVGAGLHATGKDCASAMSGKASSFTPLNQEDGKALDAGLDGLKALLAERAEEASPAFDETTIKPLQDVLSTDLSKEQIQWADFGLGEILQRLFDLDWVSAETETGHEIALHIPLSVHLIYPSKFFSEPHAAGKALNVRTTYLEWCDWIGEHQFDTEGELDL